MPNRHCPHRPCPRRSPASTHPRWTLPSFPRGWERSSVIHPPGWSPPARPGLRRAPWRLCGCCTLPGRARRHAPATCVVDDSSESGRSWNRWNRRARAPSDSCGLDEVQCAVLYLLRTGCRWRVLPGGFPKWRTVRSDCANWSDLAAEGVRLRERALKRSGWRDRKQTGA
ncbi:transposase [Xanthomonas hyacinthi]|uniref:Insertion element IS402-like domain-containing protein n=1 Tax=Xanthomonas hyacinthi TaxID=56455 RepID=A0A2S7EV25_9XANT|nr:hypothetical protein XhyaCFBP1156_13275 [Xanthomonas hyacinthi]QGY78059.1 transposase [Xanthomonas hyacinthi]